MPVSLERLIQEKEPFVITEQLTRECIQISGTDSEAIEEKKRTMHFREIEILAFGFKSIAKIDNLKGLDNLVKLQLDNNQISKIENLDHLTELTWLDLSFNKISKIEGLEKLVKLVDLSLFNNQISEIENLDTLTGLNVLSLGNNNIKRLENVMYLRQFRNLRLINLGGNPICKEHDYRSYVLSHIKDLTYLDYRRVSPADVTAAMEQHQDEMIEIQEREESAALEEKTATERAAHAKLMREANLEGVETLMEDMAREDPEWPRLQQVPGLLDSWTDIRDKFNLLTEEFKELILAQSAKKKGEHEEWLNVVKQLLDGQDDSARDLIMDFEKMKKKTARAILDSPVDAENKVLNSKVKLMVLKDALMELELATVESLQELCGEFDRNYSEVAEANRAHYNAYFTQVRDLQSGFHSGLITLAMVLYEKYNQEGSDLESLPEEAKALLQEKDTLMNALQASHDAHTAKLDALEDRLVSAELRNAAETVSANATWESRRNRDRIAEIINYIERNMQELDEMAGEEEGGEF